MTRTALGALLVAQACRTVGGGEVDLPQNARFRVRAPEADTGTVTLSEELPEEAIRRGLVPVEIGPIPLRRDVTVLLPTGWIALHADARLSSHPGCPQNDGLEQPAWYPTWTGDVTLWVSDEPSPYGRPDARVPPYGPPVDVVVEVAATCGCCLD